MNKFSRELNQIHSQHPPCIKVGFDTFAILHRQIPLSSFVIPVSSVLIPPDRIKPLCALHLRRPPCTSCPRQILHSGTDQIQYARADQILYTRRGQILYTRQVCIDRQPKSVLQGSVCAAHSAECSQVHWRPRSRRPQLASSLPLMEGERGGCVISLFPNSTSAHEQVFLSNATLDCLSVRLIASSGSSENGSDPPFFAACSGSTLVAGCI